MALIKLGNAVQDARGSLNGTTFSRNKGGAYIRTKVSPVQPKTPKQLAVRALFAANSKAWSGLLTDTQRQGWTAFAQTYPYVNVFGDSSVLTGLAMFMAKNQVLTFIDQPQITDAPPDNSVTAIPIATGASASAGADTFVFDTDAQSALADTKYYVFATPQLPAGVTPGENRYRYISDIAPTAAATSRDISTPYIANFGTLVEGQVIGLIVAQVSITKGNVTVGAKFRVVVGA